MWEGRRCGLLPRTLLEWETFAYTLGRAAAGKVHSSVLDWGATYGYARELHPQIALDYVVKDLPIFCETGRSLLHLANFVSEDAVALSRRYDLVFASGHFSHGFYHKAGQIAQSASLWLMVTRLRCVYEHDDFIVMQRPFGHGYLTEFPCWFINRDRFVRFVESCGFDLEREFLLSEAPFVVNAPEQCSYVGILFRRVANV